MTKKKKNKIISTKEIAVKCNVSTRTAQRWCKSGKLRAYKTDTGEWRTTQEDLDDMLENNVKENKTWKRYQKK